ncbi:MAG: hypothetical protein AAFQ53_17755 [Bacteroidota bacterium]
MHRSKNFSRSLAEAILTLALYGGALTIGLSAIVVSYGMDVSLQARPSQSTLL